MKGIHMDALPRSRKGFTTRRKDIDGNPMTYTVVDDCHILSLHNMRKAFCLQKLSFADGREEFRICYYMISGKGRMKGKWAFGQFAPMMSTEELKMICDQVKEKKWI